MSAIVCVDPIPEVQSEVKIGGEVKNGKSISTDDQSGSEKKAPTTDSNGFYLWKKNEIIRSPTHKYQILKHLGQGVFGTVVKCTRTKLDGGEEQQVAVKIAKSGRKWHKAAWHEFTMLDKTQPAVEFRVQHLGFFRYMEHSCIVLELLDVTLFDFLSEIKQKKMLLPLASIRRVAIDLLKGLAKLKDLNIIHTDIKPANVMLYRSESRAKLIDFGLAACETDTPMSKPYMQSRPYRAPEIIMQHQDGYGAEIDMWSLGCMMAELLIMQRQLYPGRCNYDMLRYIFDANGFPEQDFVERSQKKTVYFTKQNADQMWSLKTEEAFLEQANTYEDKAQEKAEAQFVNYQRRRTIPLDSIEMVNLTRLSGEELDVELADRKQFGDLLKRMLKFVPGERITPKEALQHSFMTMEHLAPYRHTERAQRGFRLMGRGTGTQDVVVERSMKRSREDGEEGGSAKKSHVDRPSL